MMFSDKVVSRYLMCGATYGAIRKAIQLQNVKMKSSYEYDPERRTIKTMKRPILFTEWAIAVSTHSLINSLYSPYYILNDMQDIEASIRGIHIDKPCKLSEASSLFELIT
jgi:hypothetical protein